MSRFVPGSKGGKLPDCWGHRGASASFPENTLASFEAAIRDGSDGIESDVHVSLDDVVIMFHDPSLDRTTDMTGLIREQNWYGPGGMENARTKKEPKQSIPTFAETVTLLMKPENLHTVFNIDIKVHNNPTRLFTLMHNIISSQPSWQTALAPRIILGLWHPKFIGPAKKLLPYCTRAHIGLNPALARKWFWNDVEAFSMLFFALCTWEGQSFLRDCKAAGKKVMVWTVNDPRYMMEAVRWGVDAILTDHTKTWFDLRESLYKDYTSISALYSRTFLWTNHWCWYPFQLLVRRWQWKFLEENGGPIAENGDGDVADVENADAERMGNGDGEERVGNGAEERVGEEGMRKRNAKGRDVGVSVGGISVDVAAPAPMSSLPLGAQGPKAHEE